MRQLVTNQIRTPDGTVLISYHVHDYKTHKDANGETYMVDGGTEYLRRNLTKEPAEELTVYTDDLHEKIRENCYWGSYGINGDQPLKWNVLKDMSIGHIKAVLENVPTIPAWRRKVFQDELKFRSE